MVACQDSPRGPSRVNPGSWVLVKPLRVYWVITQQWNQYVWKVSSSRVHCSLSRAISILFPVIPINFPNIQLLLQVFFIDSFWISHHAPQSYSSPPPLVALYSCNLLWNKENKTLCRNCVRVSHSLPFHPHFFSLQMFIAITCWSGTRHFTSDTLNYRILLGLLLVMTQVDSPSHGDPIILDL